MCYNVTYTVYFKAFVPVCVSWSDMVVKTYIKALMWGITSTKDKRQKMTVNRKLQLHCFLLSCLRNISGLKSLTRKAWHSKNRSVPMLFILYGCFKGQGENCCTDSMRQIQRKLVNIRCMATKSQKSYTLFEGRGKTSRSPISITQEGM